MTTTYTTTKPATIYVRVYLVGAVYHYDIVADVHETGETYTVDRARDMDAALAAAGMVATGDFFRCETRAGWMMGEGTVTR